MLPFACEDLIPLGFAAKADAEFEKMSPSAAVSTDGLLLEDNVNEELVPGSEVLAAWRAWGVRLMNGLGVPAEEGKSIHTELEQDREIRARANAAASKSGVETSSSESAVSSVGRGTDSDTSRGVSSSGSTVAGVPTTEADGKEEESNEEGCDSCTCCNELKEVKSKLKQMLQA